MPDVLRDYPLSLFREAFVSTAMAVGGVVVAILGGALAGVLLAGWDPLEDDLLLAVLLLAPAACVLYLPGVAGCLAVTLEVAAVVFYAARERWRIETLFVLCALVCVHSYLALTGGGRLAELPWIVLFVGGLGAVYGGLVAVDHWWERRATSGPGRDANR